MARDGTTGVWGAPDFELSRSSATRQVGALAAASGLGMAHFEHRAQLALPEEWTPPGQPELGEPPEWTAGVLPESKYQSFRHDLLLGSFHPGHRAKWTGHELLHGLVGFAWRPGAPRFFHALAARLAEVLPVALWYFLDEADLRRCPTHAGQGPLFGAYCAACEDAAREGPDPQAREPERWVSAGRDFVTRELAAIHRSRVTGRPVPSRFATLDLMSDGLAYAAAHAPRLASAELDELVARFFPPGTGHHPDLDSLEARVVELLDALTGVGEAAPLVGGRWRFVAQDVAARLLQIRADTERECADALSQIITDLADHPDEAGVAATVTAYRALFDDWELPPPEAVFAVGYALPHGFGSALDQIARGLVSACPNAIAAVGAREQPDLVARFAAEDLARPRRDPIGRRFAAFLGANAPRSSVTALARAEGALVHARARDPAEAALEWDGATDVAALATGLEVIRAPAGLIEDDAGDYAILREEDGTVGVHALSSAAAGLLARWGDAPRCIADLPLPRDEIAELCDAGLLVPERWTVD